MEMNVGYEGNVNLLLDLHHGLGRCHVGHGAADDLTANLLQLPDLPNRCRHIPGVGFGHGLDGDVGSAADLDSADLHRHSDPTFIQGYSPDFSWPGLG